MAPPFFPALRDAVGRLDAEGKTRVLVISSTGKHFSAGMALDTFTAGEVLPPTGTPRARLSFQDTLRRLMACFDVLDTARFPVICAIQGGCIGGALDLAAACDLRYCSADAFFCIQEINIGMTADVGTFPRLCKLIPEGWVRELAYTGRRLPAAKAQSIGLVNEVYPDHPSMVAAVLATAREIASKSPLAVAGSKVMMNYARDHSIRDGLDYIATWQTGMFSRAHMRESFTAQKEKRAPRYPDLAPLKKGM
jgi:enoyl-CoA hydratase